MKHEILPEMNEKTRRLVLDFNNIDPLTPDYLNIQKYFRECESRGVDPKLPENRQLFNDNAIRSAGCRYLFSDYAEDRIAMLEGSSIAREGRTLHLGVDIFSSILDTVHAPCDGEIIRTGVEPESHSYGHYVMFAPDNFDELYLFFGHMSRSLPQLGRIRSGEKIGTLGDYIDNENGGWSRHLHLQALRELPIEGEAPKGYSTYDDLDAMTELFPNPMLYLPGFNIQD